MVKDDVRQPWLAVFAPQIEWVNDLGIAELQPRDSSGRGSQVGNARSGVPDNSPVSETICRKVQIFEPPIQWKIFIEEDLIKHSCAYKQIAAISLFAIAVLTFSNVVQYRRSCRRPVYTRVAAHPIYNHEARRNNHILNFIQKTFHTFDEIRGNLDVIIE